MSANQLPFGLGRDEDVKLKTNVEFQNCRTFALDVRKLEGEWLKGREVREMSAF